MNINSINKLSFVMGGVCERLKENEELFVRAEGVMKSGTVEYAFLIVPKNNSYEMSLNKELSEGSFEELVSKIKEGLKNYDGIEFLFRDRISTLKIVADDKKVTTTNKNEDNTNLSQKNEEHIISPKRAKKLLSVLDFVADNGKIKNSHIRKFNQAENFLKLLAPYAQKLNKDKVLHIYDFACGKSYLSFFINYYFCEVLKIRCHITGIDIRQDVVDSSIKIRDALNYRNMDFVCADILSYVPENPVDIVVSLHACDVATDYAIAGAINNNAKVVAFVPCCHKELMNSITTDDDMAFIIKHPILKKRFNDIFTDAYRVRVLEENGYNMTLTEFVSPVDTPKNLIMLGTKKENFKKNDDALYKIESDFGVNPILRKLIF